MKRFAAIGIVPLLGLTLGMTARTATAQVFGTNGNAGIYVQGNGQAMAGTFDERGFRGIATGPDGRVRRIDSPSTANPFRQTESRSAARKPSGAVAGAMAGRTAIGPGGFDPFEFVFGSSGPTGGIGVFAGDLPSHEMAAARRAFRLGRYQETLRLANRMLSAYPGDLEAEQMKALALFALQKYDLAAASTYPVLEAGTIWSWKEVREMYPDTDTYLKHLRSLQEEARPATAAAPMFLLAYHYMMLHKIEEAREALEKTKTLQPHNPLVDELLESLPPAVNR